MLLTLLSSTKGRAVVESTHITYNHRENPAGLFASYFLIQLGIIKLQTLHKCLKALVSRSLKNVQENT